MKLILNFKKLFDLLFTFISFFGSTLKEGDITHWCKI